MEKLTKALEALLQDHYHPAGLKWFCAQLPGSRKQVEAALAAQVASGALIIGNRNFYYLPEQMSIYKGILQQSGKGYAFLLREEEEDIFLPAGQLNGAWDGDTVLVELIGHNRRLRRQRLRDCSRRQEGRVLRVVERAHSRLVGVYQNGLVYPEERRLDQPVFVGKGQANNGDHVVVNIISWSKEGARAPRGQITEIFGHRGDRGLETLTVIKKYDLPLQFPEAVQEEAAKRAVIRDSDKAGRRDLRDLTLVTIDGADARDLDDAVSLEKLPQGWRLGVHIADVAHYVRANSPLDQEAALRTTSVYFPDLVIPMLPQALSNDICSLNAGSERLAMSCLMELDEAGRVVDSEICESLICVRQRLSYEQVNAALIEHEPEAAASLGELVPLLEQMLALKGQLRANRQDAGSIDFDFPETKVVMGADGQVAEIIRREQGEAESLIEEFMLLANQTVATVYHQEEAPLVYRVHEACGMDELPQLNEMLAPFGLAVVASGRKLHPRTVQSVLQAAQGTPGERLVSLILLRSMNHACYTTEPRGHFALAMPYYCHFTSPIRRYPDLLVHRVIKAYLKKGALKDSTRDSWRAQLEATAGDCSEKERRAEEVERQVVKAKCCQYMQQFIGQYFPGHISGVTGYGLYVELANGVEGLIRVSNLDDDFYEYDEKRFTLTGRRTGKIFRLGDPLEIQVLSVDEENMFIDFLPA